jgi:prepilin-type N-terminal cleavage/methylation domain-containing protein
MKKNNGGFSLIEVLVAIVVLAAVVIPTCSALVLSHRLNAETDKLMKAQLAVSSAVETLMAEGIDAANNNYENRFEGVTVVLTPKDQNDTNPYYEVTVKVVEKTADNTEKEVVSVTTTIRAK